MVDLTPAASNAFLRNGRSTVSQRTDDLESGSSTATLPEGFLLPELPESLELLLSSLPHAPTVTARAATLAQDARHDPRVLRGRRDGVPAHGLSHRVEQEVARLAQVAPHHDRVGVQDVADRRHGAPEDAPRVGDRALAAGVPLAGQPHDVADGEDLPAAAAQQLAERRPGDVGLQAAAIAAAADR